MPNLIIGNMYTANARVWVSNKVPLTSVQQHVKLSEGLG